GGVGQSLLAPRGQGTAGTLPHAAKSARFRCQLNGARLLVTSRPELSPRPRVEPTTSRVLRAALPRRIVGWHSPLAGARGEGVSRFGSSFTFSRPSVFFS